MHILRLALLALLCGLGPQVFGQITPDAPVKDFRLPRFGENGYTQWVLQGGEGIYDSDEQIRIKGMALRVYSGDERMALELSLDSPEATLYPLENRAASEGSIEIKGANFLITGLGWEWSGATKEIVVKQYTRVQFSQTIAGALNTGLDAENSSDGATEIQSDRLVLRTNEDEYYFEFTGNVRAQSDGMQLKSEQLIAFADPPEGRITDATTETDKRLDSIQKIIARDDVIITQGDRVVRAQDALFLPREQQATLEHDASIETPGAYLSGARIVSESGKLHLTGSESAGRAQTILTETGGLGIQGASALSSETIVLADSILMEERTGENFFLFDGQVEVLSGALQMQAGAMRISARNTDSSSTDEDVQVGEVRQVFADGGIRIEQGKQVATAKQVTFYPAEERAVLEGSPRVTNGEAVVTGDKMELQPKLALVSTETENPVTVRLPEMPDLGYKAYSPTKSPDSPAPVDEAAELRETVVTSRLLRMEEEPTRTLFRFTDDVKVAATNLDATCERLDVIARELESDAERSRLEVERVEAHDSVEIRQSSRVATSKRAFILPKEGKVILEDEAVVSDERGQVSGYRMTLLQGERRAIVEGGVPGQERAKITLPAMPVK